MHRERLWSLAAIFVLPLLLIGARLWQVQVLQASELADRANASLQRVRFYPGHRGSILSAEGQVLVADQPTYDLTFRLAELDPCILPSGWLAHYLELDKPTVRQQLLAGGSFVQQGPPEGRPAIRARLLRRIPELQIDGDTLALPNTMCRQLSVSLRAMAELCDRPLAELASTVEARLERVWARETVWERRIGLRSPFTLVRGLEAEIAWEIAERANELPGLEVEVRLERSFPQQSLAAHVLGFRGRLGPEDVQRLRGEDRKQGNILEDRRRHLSGIEEFLDIRAEAHFMDDRIGKTGLEGSYETWLRGQPGAEWVEVARGERVTSVLDAVEPEAGKDLSLFLRCDIQKSAEEKLRAQVDHLWQGKRESFYPEGGAAVLMDVETGALYAMASYPSYSLASRRPTDPLAELLGERAPFVNRACAASFATGSVFKVFSGYEALARGRLSPAHRVLCNNALDPRHPRQWRCPNHAGGMSLNLRDALKYSCNVFFYTVGESFLQPAELCGGARAFGFGSPTGVDLPGERSGRLPDPDWKRDQYQRARDGLTRASRDLELARRAPPDSAAMAQAERRLARAEERKRYWDDRTGSWLPGDSRNLAIGQGDFEATPLQVARALAALANGGRLPTPRLASHVPASWQAVTVDPAARAAVLDAMEVVVRSGTASNYELHDLPWRVAAKTGTAQAPSRPISELDARRVPADHAWLAGVAPAEDPQVVFVVLVESVPEGKHGGEVCSPVAAAMLRAWFEKEAP